MKTYIFAWYPHMPIPCEGDDPITRVIRLRLKALSRVDQTVRALERRHGGFVQWWA